MQGERGKLISRFTFSPLPHRGLKRSAAIKRRTAKEIGQTSPLSSRVSSTLFILKGATRKQNAMPMVIIIIKRAISQEKRKLPTIKISNSVLSPCGSQYSAGLILVPCSPRPIDALPSFALVYAYRTKVGSLAGLMVDNR